MSSSPSNLKRVHNNSTINLLSKAHQIEGRKYFFKRYSDDDIEIKNDEYVLIVEEEPWVYGEDNLNELMDFSNEFVIGLYKNTLVFVNRKSLKD